MLSQFLCRHGYRYIGVLTALFATITMAFAGPKTSAGPYHIELTTEPAVITTGKATLHLRVTDSANRPVRGASIQSLTKMPTMAMGEREITATPNPKVPGDYTAPAQFAMEGAYEATLRIDGPLGPATATIPLQTGQNTVSEENTTSPMLLWALAGIVVVGFVVYRVRKSGQTVRLQQLVNRQVIGGLSLLLVMTAAAVYAVQHFRRAGALTPLEAQAMDMTNLPAPTGAAPVELATVSRGDVEATVRYAGTVVGYGEQDIVARVTGSIQELAVYTGDRVTKGQLLARLDTSQTEPQLQQQRAGAQMAERGVAVAVAEKQQAAAEVQWAHAELAGRVGALNEAKSQLVSAQEEKNAATAQVASAQARIDEATAEVTAMQADQTYWQAQIQRSTRLREAGAISGEEFQRDRAQADAAEAKVRQARARLTQAKNDQDAALSTVRKAEAQITAANARVQMTQSELDAHNAHVQSSRAAIHTADARIAQAQSGVVQAQAGVQAATATRGYAEVRATTDGMVTQRLISPGVLVAPGQVLVKVAQLSPIRLQANVPERDLERIRVGSRVRVYSGKEGNSLVEATITSVAPAVDPTSRTGTIEAVIPNRDRRFLPGQFVTLEPNIGTEEGTLFVPNVAIAYRTPNTDGVQTTTSQPFVWAAEPTGQSGQFTARRIGVTLGVQGKERTAIRTGLSEGMKVVLSGATYLKDGDMVADIARENAHQSGTGNAVATENGIQTAKVIVSALGYTPDHLSLKAGVPARITFLRTSDQTCGTEVIFTRYNITKKLPLNQPVTVEFTPTESGDTEFLCGMNMLRGKVVVK